MPAAGTVLVMRNKAIRYNSDDTVDTATWVMLNPKTGKTCTLIGMTSIGDAGYCETMSAQLERAATAGEKIIYGKTRSVTDEEAEGLPADEAELLAKMRAAAKAPTRVSKVADLLDLSVTAEAVIYPEGAINVDFSDLELVRHEFVPPAPGENNYQALEGVPKDRVRLMAEASFKHPILMSAGQILLPNRRRNFRRHMARTILSRVRNDRAMEAINEHLKADSVTLAWAVNNLPVIRADLKFAGYRLTEVTWRKAFSL